MSTLPTKKSPMTKRLHRAGKVGEPHAVAQRSEQQQRQQDADDTASAAENVDAAEHHGGDDEQQQIAGVVRARRLILADVDKRGEAGHEAADGEGGDLDRADADAGEARRLRAASHDIGAPAVNASDASAARKRRRRSASAASETAAVYRRTGGAAKPDVAVIEAGVALLSAETAGEGAIGAHRAERDGERGQAEADDERGH